MGHLAAQEVLLLGLKLFLVVPVVDAVELMAHPQAQGVLPVELKLCLVVPVVEAVEPVAPPEAQVALLPPEIVEQLPLPTMILRQS
jgi:hypothetical protein